MILCLVTDRRRHADAGRGLLEQARRAADAGVDVLQVRERDMEAVRLVELVGRIVDATRGSATRVVVNDRIDVAVAASAAGVHLRHDSLSIAAARRLAAPFWLIGRSVHDAEELGAATGADYAIAGTVFPSASKPGGALLGLEGLRVLAASSPVALLAIGGVTIERVADVAAAGAAGVAAIGLFLRDDLKGVVSDARRRFDSARPASYHLKRSDA